MPMIMGTATAVVPVLESTVDKPPTAIMEKSNSFFISPFGQLQSHLTDLIGKTGDERRFADDEHGHEQHYGVVAEVAERHFGSQNTRTGKTHGHEHGRDGQRKRFRHEQQRGNDEDARVI